MNDRPRERNKPDESDLPVEGYGAPADAAVGDDDPQHDPGMKMGKRKAEQDRDNTSETSADRDRT